jgi:selenium metabolism protein YedF
MLIVINSDHMGSGHEDLGKKLVRSCLRKFLNSHDLEVIVFYNAGAKLATKDSPVADELRTLQQAGVDLLVCGTCVDFYDIADDLLVDRQSNMEEIVKALHAADKVVTL